MTAFAVVAAFYLCRGGKPELGPGFPSFAIQDAFLQQGEKRFHRCIVTTCAYPFHRSMQAVPGRCPGPGRDGFGALAGRAVFNVGAEIPAAPYW